MANYKESKVVAAAAQAALKEASDKEDNRQNQVGEGQKTLEKTKRIGKHESPFARWKFSIARASQRSQ
jgi:hypothetical protein